MTDLPPRDPDQLASDLVDGLLPPDEAARLRGAPEIAARVARIEQLRGALRAVPPPPPGAADRMVAAAVAAARAAGVPQAPPGPGGPAPRHLLPVPPAFPRPQPQPSRGSGRPWLAAAAAVIFAGLVTAGLVASSGGHDDQDSAGESSADAPVASSEEDRAGADAGAGDDSSMDDGSTEAAPGELAPTTPPAQLGSFDDAEALAAGVAGDRMRTTASEEQGGPATSASVDSAAACPGLEPAGDVARGTASYVADAVFDGEVVKVHLYESGGTTRLVATTLDCVDVVDVPFDG